MNEDAVNDLVARMRQGDVMALAALYDRFATLVYSLALRITRNSADAEDVAQEVFLQAWQQAAKFDSGRAAVGGWLAMMTRSRALDRLRRMAGRSRREQGLARAEHLVPAREWAADQALIQTEDTREVRREFELLPAIQRVPLELAFYEGLTYSQIADVLCQPLGTVKTRIRLALLRMRDGLSEQRADSPAREPSPFTVALAEHLARHPVLTPAYRSLRGLQLLVVDDDAETVDLVATVLQSAGATVTTARSTPDGLARLGAAWPDVLLADILMPRDDGYSLIRQARVLAETSGRRLTALAFTALGAGEHDRALRAGFATFVPKPVQPHTLIDVVARVASRAA